ncbi:preprotein translocase subunit SecG [Paracoccus aerodenitrificans]|uniref:preprotein translocase subunit SecG n=1 Tax=Paracoccus aerodenitrificans TaxID=3017781 RepID=UPI0022F12549|nr:preprotein translocase subunit SecG [Paracoccus aerodenitrificans]WBU63328.1 preprotein translocase subunit SecG [Paracoccus aerodenitrificans]
MENVVLTVHLILALLLIGIVLLQRSEGGGLGMGGGGGGTGVMTGRQAANALSKLTWILAAAFLVTSITLTVIAARNTSGNSVLDQLNIGTGSDDQSQEQTGIEGTGLTTAPPPGVGQPITPPSADAPAASEAPASDASPAAPPAVEAQPDDSAPASEAAPAEASAESGSAAQGADSADAPVAPPAAN